MKFNTVFQLVQAACLAMLVVMAPAADARPTGAPKCAVNPTAIMAAHKKPSTIKGNVIRVTPTEFTPGGTYKVKIVGPKGWKGLLLYAAAGEAISFTLPNGSFAADPRKQHVGKFTNLPQNFRAQTQAICDAVKVQNDALTETEASTITHANPSDKGVVEFTYVAPQSGPITFTAAIVQGMPGAPWGITNQVTLGGTGAGASTTTGNSTTGTGTGSGAADTTTPSTTTGSESGAGSSAAAGDAATAGTTPGAASSGFALSASPMATLAQAFVFSAAIFALGH